MQTSELVSFIVDKIDDLKGRDIVTLDVRGKSSVTEFMVICSGTSNRHTKSIADYVAAEVKKAGIPTLGTAIDTIKETLGGVQVAAAPLCAHGHMIWREGTAKTGKGWGGYMCSEKAKAKQCAPAWYMLGSDGQWRPQV